ncbi:MAG: HAD family phosphatase [Cyclobacteriaceae bacterium]|nr:HAD family phosphatase [Cyclobacteriaceae bacterium]MDW8330072.1 HAD family phosphatase [Cyclobacteriaceae bacterium]
MKEKQLAVLFDMDGVIADTNPFHQVAIRQFCEKYGFSLTEDEMKRRIYGRTNTDWITALFGKLTSEALQRYADEKEALFRQMYAPYVRPVEGLIGFLNDLQSANIPCALTTSAPPANVEFLMQHIPVRHHFRIVLDERSVTNGKPNPEIYLKAAAALQLPNERCIVMEDSLSGIKAGKAAGSKVIGITTTHTPDELADADLTVENFNQLSLNDLYRLMD